MFTQQPILFEPEFFCFSSSVFLTVPATEASVRRSDTIIFPWRNSWYFGYGDPFGGAL